MSESIKKYREPGANVHEDPRNRNTRIDVAKRFHDANTSWRMSDCRKALQERLKDWKPRAGWGIKRAILMAIGNLEIARIGFEDRSITQLVVFLDIVGMSISSLNLLVDGRMLTCL